MKMNIIPILINEALSISVGTNLIERDVFDATFNLLTGKYVPNRKLNKNPIYINAKSNHPYTIIKDFPKMINKCLSDLSATKRTLIKHKKYIRSVNFKCVR